MTDEEIARSTLYRLQVLAGKQLTPEQFESQALAIIGDAASAARREGETAGIRMGTRHAREAQEFVRNQRLFAPISAAEVNKAEEPS